MMTKVIWVAGFLLTLFFLRVGFATEISHTEQLLDYLTQEKITLQALIVDSTTAITLDDTHDLVSLKRQNGANLALLRAQIDSLEALLAREQEQSQILADTLKNLQQSPINKMQEDLRRAELNTKIELNDKIIARCVDNLTYARRYQEALLLRGSQLDVLQATKQEEASQHALQEKINALETQRDALYKKNIILQQVDIKVVDSAQQFKTQLQQLLNNQQIILIQNNIQLIELQKRFMRSNYTLLLHHDINTLQDITKSYNSMLTRLDAISVALTLMKKRLADGQAIFLHSELNPEFINLKKQIFVVFTQIKQQRAAIQVESKRREIQLKEQLVAFQSLRNVNLNSWAVVTAAFLNIPAQIMNYTKSLVLKISENYVWATEWLDTLLWIILSGIFCGSIILSRFLSAKTARRDNARFAEHFYDVVLRGIYYNLPHLTSLCMLLIVCFINNVAFDSYQLFVNLLLIWLLFRNLHFIARVTLLERGRDDIENAKLYRRLKWLLLAGGWTTAFMVMSNQLPLSLFLQSIFDRLFMFFLLALSLLAFKSKKLLPSLLQRFLKTKKHYVRHAIALLGVLVPLTVLTTALIGLIGYMNLAWTMSHYQIVLLLVITGYVLTRDLILDGLEVFSEWMVSSWANGWLLIEVFLKPLEKIMLLALLFLSFFIIFQFFGWTADSWIMAHVMHIGVVPIINLSGMHITLFSSLECIILVSIFIWITKWTREFCYRWLYRNFKDTGIRNSLSVFSQYGVALLGTFVALRALGIDLTGMSMVLGGLAVGLGFGLRDFASNIVGGVMLLIERPVREGDLITIGEYEGRVAHIGLRSMRVSSWDNMEVLIPNAEAFNKPFTNWTHQDSIIRTVFPVKVQRDDDTIFIQKIIHEALLSIPEVLTTPAAQVFLKKIDDALIEFEVRYFVNVELHSNFEVRSNVLFAIMARFKEAGIKPPIPPFSVEMTDGEALE